MTSAAPLIIVFATLVGLLAYRYAGRATDMAPTDGRSDAEARRELLDALAPELERSRRYERPLALVRVACDASGLQHEAAALARSVRRTDHVFAAGTTLYVLSPETDAAGAQLFAKRLAVELAPDGAAVASASFPEHALTARSLFAQLDADEPAVPAWADAAAS